MLGQKAKLFKCPNQEDPNAAFIEKQKEQSTSGQKQSNRKHITVNNKPATKDKETLAYMLMS